MAYINYKSNSIAITMEFLIGALVNKFYLTDQSGYRRERRLCCTTMSKQLIIFSLVAFLAACSSEGTEEPILDLPVVGVWEIEQGDYLFIHPDNIITRATHDPNPFVFCVEDIRFIATYDERDGRIFSDDPWLMNSQMTRKGSELFIESFEHGYVVPLQYTGFDVNELTYCP